MTQVTEETRENLNPSQQAVLKSVEILWHAAQTNKGRGFTAEQIQHIAGYLNSLSVGLMEHEQRQIGYERMIKAYTDAYGEELFRKLMAEGPVVEGEVIEQVPTSTGQGSESERLDSSHQEEE